MRFHVDARGLAVLVLAMVLPAQAQEARREADSKEQAGRQLSDVLQSLQASGLRIVFSSNIVTPDMRVRVEPRASTPRGSLDEILAPHGLVAREGPGGVLQIVRAPRTPELTSSPIPPADQQEPTTLPSPLPVYKERITVISPWPWWQPIPGVAEETVNRRVMTVMPAGLIDDPVQAIQSMPRVAPLGDYQSEFVVRASPFRQAEVVVDGVSTSWLRHAPVESASVSMFTTQLLDSATLRAGAYARTYGDHLGPQLELTLREGSRDRVHVRGTIANTAATIVGEGPIGDARGSWIVAARQSLLEWPGENVASVPVFGFSDGLGKLAFDVSDRHRLGFSLITGRSRVDVDEDVNGGSPIQPAAQTSVANLSLRSTIGPTTVLTQRAYVIRRELAREPHPPTAALSLGTDEEMVYRASLATKMPLGVLQSGAQIGTTTWQSADRSASVWTRSGYVNLQARAGNRLTISPGVRVSGASHVSRAAISPWLLGEMAMGRWTIAASAGASHQFPEIGREYAVDPPDRLQAERAIHADVSVRQRVSAGVRWEATLYQRREQGILDRNDGRLAGLARGLEFVVERSNTTGLSGWAAYSYGRARHTDAAGGESFWADFDQRHAVAAFGLYRWSDSTSVGATIRIGSGVPMPGHLSRRLPTYSRFDVRADRDIRSGDRRLHAFVEVVNLFGHSNAASSHAPLTPRRASVGMTIGF